MLEPGAAPKATSVQLPSNGDNAFEVGKTRDAASQIRRDIAVSIQERLHSQESQFNTRYSNSRKFAALDQTCLLNEPLQAACHPKSR